MSEVNITQSAIDRIKEITAKESNIGKFLRVSITGGGCSGFQYVYELDNKSNEDDIKIAVDGEKLLAVTDPTSLDFLKGAEIDFKNDLGASYFKVNNPNATDNCGCGSSFSV